MSRAASPVLDGWSVGQVCVHFGIMTLCFVYLFFFFFLNLIWSSGRKWNLQEWYKEFVAECRLVEHSVSTRKSCPWHYNGRGCQWRQQISSSQLRKTVEEIQSFRVCGQAFQVQNVRMLWSQIVFGGLDVNTSLEGNRVEAWRVECLLLYFLCGSRIFIPLTPCGLWGVENYTSELTVQ